MLPFALNTLTQATALASLAAEESCWSGSRLCQGAQPGPRRADRPGWTVAPTEANFVWRPLSENAAEFSAVCEQEGISIWAPPPDEVVSRSATMRPTSVPRRCQTVRAPSLTAAQRARSRSPPWKLRDRLCPTFPARQRAAPSDNESRAMGLRVRVCLVPVAGSRRDLKPRVLHHPTDGRTRAQQASKRSPVSIDSGSGPGLNRSFPTKRKRSYHERRSRPANTGQHERRHADRDGTATGHCTPDFASSGTGWTPEVAADANAVTGVQGD